jgi:hypothetical protein
LFSERDMKPLIAALMLVLALASPARAQERVGSAALGALSGGLVFGPVGLVAGAVVGFTAGPMIAQSWRAKRHQPRPQARSTKPPAQVAARQAKPGTVTPSPAAAGPAPGVDGPPVQGLE